MQHHAVVSKDEWLKARKELLQKEKTFTRQRDQLSRERRALPWVNVDKEYVFDTPKGKETLSELFESRSQLLVYHFMFGRDWKEGCPSCSFLADHFDGIDRHLRHRDVTLLAVSQAPLHILQKFQTRLRWNFKWASSFASDFSKDFHVSFSPEQMQTEKTQYNYEACKPPSEELPGASAFIKDEAGTVFHTYSTYSRGLDMLIGTYHFLDLVPKGRDEDALAWPMEWVRHHDKYDDIPDDTNCCH